MIVHIPFEDLKLFEKYKRKYPGTVLKKGCIEIPILEPYLFPLDTNNFPKESKFLFLCYECGGATTSVGKAEIICDVEGKKLKPYRVFKSGHLSNNKHAQFHVEHPICVSVTKLGTCVIDEKYFILVKNKLYVEKEMLWYGNIEELPKSYSCYQEAVTAAHSKANDFHCRTPYYIIDGKDIYGR
jgi:hypothetical protein